MKIGKTIENILNKQMQAEFSSAYLYLSMAAWFECQNLPGCAHWMRKQAEEEAEHAMKFFDYLAVRGCTIRLGALPEPKCEWNNATDVFEGVYAHESAVTEMICAVMEQARKDKDYVTENFIAWFINEQLEEEASSLQILEKFRKMGESPILLVMIDKELAAR